MIQKKFLSIAVLAMCCCLCACGNSTAEDKNDIMSSVSAENTYEVADESTLNQNQFELNQVEPEQEYDVGGLPMVLHYSEVDEEGGGSIELEYDDTTITVADYVEQLGTCRFYKRSDSMTYLLIDGCWSNDEHDTYPVLLTQGQVYAGTVLKGEVNGLAENGNLIMEQEINIFGTYRGQTEYTFDGENLVAVDYLYELVDEKELVLMQDVQAYSEDGEFTVEAETTIYPYACNTETQQFYFTTNEGGKGFLAYDYDDGTLIFTINGILEDELFKSLPYAG